MIIHRWNCRQLHFLLADGFVFAGMLLGDYVGKMFYAGECYVSYLRHILSVAASPFPAIQLSIGGYITAKFME